MTLQPCDRGAEPARKEGSLSEGSSGKSLRVLFLAAVNTYRASAFWEAGRALGIECRMAVDMDPELAASGRHGWGFPFSDPQEAVDRILEVDKERPWNAILALDDTGSEIAARASRSLGLPHNSPSAARAARDKFEMRKCLAAAGLHCPSFTRVGPGDDPFTSAEEIGYPVVIKPLDLNGSQGVMRADTARELEKAVRRLREMLEGPDEGGAAPYLIERYVPGVEYAVEAIIAEETLHVLAIFDKPDPLEGPFFEESIYVTPSRAPETAQATLREATREAARALGLGFGPVHAELRLNDGGAWIIEVAGRSIGGLCSQTLRFGTAESLESLILRQACGLDLPALDTRPAGSGVMMIPIPEAGIFKGIEGVADAERVPGVTGIEITARPGYPLRPLPEGNSYLGFIFAEAATPADAEKALRQAHGQLQIDMQPEFELVSV